MAKQYAYHHLHVRIDLPIWKRLRELFPEYGHIRKVTNLALAQFIKAWEEVEERERQARLQPGHGSFKPDTDGAGD